MDQATATQLLKDILDEISVSSGDAAVEKFSSLRAVDAKIREVRRIFRSLPDEIRNLSAEMEADEDFGANSRRVRLEALQNYMREAQRLLHSGAVSSKKKIYRAPNIEKLTTNLPGLDYVIKQRWSEAQRCQHAGAYLAAVVIMGSILEGLLLARAQMSPQTAYQSARAPKEKSGKDRPIHEWKLTDLIDVAVDVGWVNVDRGKFGHALRESRNVVHPWQQVSLRVDYDDNTCRVCWNVLTASVNDLLNSL